MLLKKALLWVGFACLCANTAQASPISDPALRRRLAMLYAPEIRQDQRERYGIGSIPYFLAQSDLMAEMRGCTRAKRNSLRSQNQRNASPKQSTSALAIRVGDGTWLSVRDVFSWRTDDTCDLRYAAFSTSNTKPNQHTLLAAPNNLYLRFRQKDDATLLRGAFRFAVTPEISFRVYERQIQRCLRRNLMRLCVEERVDRFYIVQYFVPLMYNDACNTHEGEHEGMVVTVDMRKFEAARTPEDLRKSVVRVGYYGHYKTKVFSPEQVTFVEGTHPVAYMGSLGHALYPRAGKTDMSSNFPIEIRPWVRRICTSRGLSDRLTEWHRGNGPIYRAWLPPDDPRAIERTGAEMPKEGWLDWRNIRLRGIFPSPQRTPPTSMPLLIAPSPKFASKSPSKTNSANFGTPTPATYPSRILAHEAGLQPLSIREKQLLSKKLAFTPRCLSPKEYPAVRMCDVQAGNANSPCCLGQLYKDHVRWVSFAGRWGNQEPFASGLRGAAAAQLGRVMKRWPLARSLGNSGPFGPRWIHQTTWHWLDPLKNPAPTPSVWR